MPHLAKPTVSLDADPYRTLGLMRGASLDEVKRAYCRLAKANHPDALNQWPTNVIFGRLHQFFADGRINDVERRELQELLASLVGGTASVLCGYEGGTTLPLDDPAPLICWDCTYVFTGRFAYGTRKHCEAEVKARGGWCEPTVTKRAAFVVIGTFGSRDWKHSNYGRKIQHAVKLREAGTPIKIVGEDHWAKALTPLASPLGVKARRGR